jgi:hypothetical protein
MDDILERQRLQREREKKKQRFDTADLKFSTDVFLVLHACRVTCMRKFI